jgi:hypothetical protein
VLQSPTRCPCSGNENFLHTFILPPYSTHPLPRCPCLACAALSLDFLRKCRELSEWYGPSFYFVANPLMLPFPLHPALESGAIDVTQQV